MSRHSSRYNILLSSILHRHCSNQQMSPSHHGWRHIPPSRFRPAILDRKQASPSRHTAMAPLSTNNPEYAHRQDTLGGGQSLPSCSSSPLPTTLRGKAGNPSGLSSHAASGPSMDPYVDALGVTKKTRHQLGRMDVASLDRMPHPCVPTIAKVRLTHAQLSV
jgi:hypothetical protein